MKDRFMVHYYISTFFSIHVLNEHRLRICSIHTCNSYNINETNIHIPLIDL